MTNLVALVRWAGLLCAVEWLGEPIARRLLGKNGKRLWLPLFLLLWAYFYWTWGNLFSFPANGGATYFSGGFAFLLLFGACRLLPPVTRDGRRKRFDPIFWLTFGVAIILRGYSPSMEMTERYPDTMFFQSVLQATSFPPQDLWLSGFTLNYYYFSQLLFVPLTKATGVPPEWAFNLATITIAALTSSAAYGAVYILCENRWAALYGALSSILLSNWEWIKANPFSWWGSSRAMGDTTITEFPFFSFLLGDFHAHYSALPWLSLTFGLLVLFKDALEKESKNPKWVLGILLSLAVGLHYPLNPWELPIVALLTALILGRRFQFTGIVGASAFLLYLPFWLEYKRPVSEIGIVPATLRSPLFPFSLHWALFLIPLLVLAFFYTRETRFRRSLELGGYVLLATMIGGPVCGLLSIFLAAFWGSGRLRLDRPEIALFFCAILGILFCEFVHLDNLYAPDLRRMNTVFKFYMIGWWALSISVPVLIVREVDFFTKWSKVWIAVLALITFTSLVYPFRGFLNRREYGAEIPTWDGMMAWNQLYPGEREIVDWLRVHAASKDILLEAVGPAYQHFSRFSVFSGRPTFLGWPNHEWVWRRKGFQFTGIREEKIAELIKNPTDVGLKDFLKKYDIRWILIGNLERNTYSPQLLDLIAKFPLAFKTDSTAVFSVLTTYHY